MKLGSILMWGDDVSAFRGQVGLADELGYDVIGVGDVPDSWHELWVGLTLAAVDTERATVTTMVTTPFLRHPVVTAAAISALDELTGGRAALTIGGGGSAPRAIGRSRATAEETKAYVAAMRELLRGQAVEYEGSSCGPLMRARSVPVRVAADGPTGLRAAAESGDGVILTVGLDLGLVDDKIEVVRTAAIDAGRDPDKLEIWGLSFVSVRETREEANRDLLAYNAWTAGAGFQKRWMRALLPPDLVPHVEEIERHYDPVEHVVVGGRNTELLRSSELVDFIVGINCITGNPEQVASHVLELESRGVSCLLAALPGSADPEGTMKRLRLAVPDNVSTKGVP